MSRLTIHADSGPGAALLDTTDFSAIQAALGDIGIRFERWKANRALAPDADQDAILEAYRDDIARLVAEGGYQSVDVIRVLPDNPQRDALRAKFLAEHTHADDEVRFFVEGAGMFYLRKNARVHMMLCEAGDLISVPAGTKHWFDMGPAPRFAAIRLFTTPDGWVADFTGDTIATRFPAFDAEPA